MCDPLKIRYTHSENSKILKILIQTMCDPLKIRCTHSENSKIL